MATRRTRYYAPRTYDYESSKDIPYNARSNKRFSEEVDVIGAKRTVPTILERITPNRQVSHPKTYPAIPYSPIDDGVRIDDVKGPTGTMRYRDHLRVLREKSESDGTKYSSRTSKKELNTGDVERIPDTVALERIRDVKSRRENSLSSRIFRHLPETIQYQLRRINKKLHGK